MESWNHISGDRFEERVLISFLPQKWGNSRGLRIFYPVVIRNLPTTASETKSSILYFGCNKWRKQNRPGVFSWLIFGCERVWLFPGCHSVTWSKSMRYTRYNVTARKTPHHHLFFNRFAASVFFFPSALSLVVYFWYCRKIPAWFCLRNVCPTLFTTCFSVVNKRGFAVVKGGHPTDT